jgi:hypothetical protein
MKSVFVSSLSALILCLNLSPAAKAEVAQIAPFNLVNQARNGSFEDQGIPSHARFTAAVKARRIQAEDLVKAAIAQKKLSPETLNDRRYLNIVELKLNSLSRR